MRSVDEHTHLRFSKGLVLVGVSAWISVLGQPISPEFEVASIKPHLPNSGFHDPSCVNGRFNSVGAPLDLSIIWAYDLKSDAVRELFQHRVPIENEYYDIQAKVEHPVTESECRLMVQALLRDRFKFAAHWESRNAEIYDMFVAPGGPKFREATDADPGEALNVVTDGHRMSRPPALEPEPKGWTMQQLAEFLSARRYQPIVDQTGLEGRYKIDLRFSTKVPSTDQQVLDPELEPALLKQLGLRLEKRKGTIEVLIVDHIERPTAN
jgi:uncharacterized protein (TIGR03435 family)